MDNKPDIVEFIEVQCNIKLLEYQKELVRKMYDAGPNVKIVFPYKSGYTNYRHLAYMIEELLRR